MVSTLDYNVSVLSHLVGETEQPFSGSLGPDFVFGFCFCFCFAVCLSFFFGGGGTFRLCLLLVSLVKLAPSNALYFWRLQEHVNAVGEDEIKYSALEMTTIMS